MNKVLDVYLNQMFVGIYQQDKDGKKSFSYDQKYLADKMAIPLSNSLPLQNTKYDDKVCHSFFGGFLPEESQRRLVAKIYGVSASNDFSILEKIGGECAGAISFYLPKQTIQGSKSKYLELSELELSKRIQELPEYPLLLGYDDLRLSLAGVQDKITVAINNNKIYLPLQGSASTHILKPEIGYHPSTVVNEALCLQLAKKIGINTIDSEIDAAGTCQYLLVARYDRYGTYPNIKRIHQEDFCQALAISSERKYQAEGGPTLQQCFHLIRNISSNPVKDIMALLDAVIFNFVIGNCDAHGKNFSILYLDNKEIRLSPFYDLLSTAAYPKLSTKMAMKIGGEYELNQIRAKHFMKFAEIAELNSTIVLQRVTEISELIISNIKLIKLAGKDARELEKIIIERAIKILQW